MEASFSSSWPTQEMAGARLPDERFRPNLIRMCERLVQHCSQSFSAACGPAVRKAAHRLFSKPGVDLQAGHRQETVERCKELAQVFVLEDTTDLNYAGHTATADLGHLGGPSDVYGIAVHSALVVSAEQVPLGLLGQHYWAPVNARPTRAQLKSLPIEAKESYRWLRVLDWVGTELQDYKGQVVVVADREGDFYEHFAQERAVQTELLIRAAHRTRQVIYQGQRQSLAAVLPQLPVLGTQSLDVRARPGQAARRAELQLAAGALQCPPSLGHNGPTLPLWVVWVHEVDEAAAPAPALDWVLLTTLAVEQLEQAQAISRAYSLRWMIERFHYVLKQGLKIERLQFDTYIRLVHALQVCSVVAWQILRLAYLAKSRPREPAQAHFAPADSALLSTLTQRPIQTVHDQLLALGKLVGFVSSAKQPYPGEKLLWQAWQHFQAVKVGFDLARGNYGTG